MAFPRLQFRSSAEERASLRGQVETLQKERDELAATCESLRQDAIEHAELKESAAASAAVAETATAEVQTLRTDGERLRKSLEEERTHLQSSREETEKLAAQLKRSSDDLAAARTALSGAETRAAECRAKQSQHAQEAQAAEKLQEAAAMAKTLAEAEVVSLQKQLEELRTQLREANLQAKRCIEAEAEVAKLREGIQNTQNAADEQVNGALRSQQESKELADTLQVRLHAAQRDLEAAESKFRSEAEATAHSRIDAIETDAKSRVAEAEARMRDALADAAQWESRSATAETRVAELENDLTSRLTVDEARELNQRLLEAERAATVAAEQLAAAQHEAEEKSTAAEMAAQANALHAQRDADQKIASLDAELESVQTQHDNLQSELSKALADVAAANANADLSKASAMDRVQSLEAEVLRLQGELSDKRMEVEAQKMVHYDHGREIQHLQDKLQDAIGEIERLQLRLALSMGGEPDAAMCEFSEQPTSRCSTPSGSCRNLRRGVSSCVPPLPNAGTLMSSARRSSPATHGNSSARGSRGPPTPRGAPPAARKSPREQVYQVRRPPGAPAKLRQRTPSTAAPSDTEDVC
jgi:chromosome segregation ATPase